MYDGEFGRAGASVAGLRIRGDNCLGGGFQSVAVCRGP